MSEGDSQQVVAVYEVGGAISETTAAEFRKFHRAVMSDSKIKAVVLRVDSPGGMVAPSDEICQMVRDIQDSGHKPVIVSMGGVAASGGYYISAPAKRIIAEPTTVTGSIGVIAVWPVLKDFLNEHGVQVVTIRSPQARGNKATENYWEIPSQRTCEDVENMLKEMDNKFIEVVKAGRPDLKTKEVPAPPSTEPADKPEMQIEPLNGKVYLAKEAKEWGLVDAIGYLPDAVEAAAKEAGLSKPKEVHYYKSATFREVFGANQSASLLDEKALDKLMTPQIMMMWKPE